MGRRTAYPLNVGLLFLALVPLATPLAPGRPEHALRAGHHGAASRLLAPPAAPLDAAVTAAAAAVPGLDAVPTVFDSTGLDAMRAAGVAAAAEEDEEQGGAEAAEAEDLEAAHLEEPHPWRHHPPPRRHERRRRAPRRPQSEVDAGQAAAAAFDPDRARLLAALQSIVYCGNLSAIRDWTCRRCGAVPGFQASLVHFDAAYDLVGYAGYLPSLGAKVVVFRGTDSSSWANWINNMRAWRTDAAYPVPGAPKSLRIHSGFHVLWAASSMAAAFKEGYAQLLAAHPAGPTYVLGHSMGGALAHLAALDLRAAFDPPQLRVVTFGAPRVGNGAFAEFFRSAVEEAWRFSHGRDVVPSLPPTLMGFHHAAREVWLVDVDRRRGAVGAAAGGGLAAASSGSGGSGRGGGGSGGSNGAADGPLAIIVCDDSGEDPSCHNSACRLGLCTSIADHLLYWAHMFAADEC